MKKAFAIASIAVWTLGLLIGLGFVVVGQVNATNRLPAENYALLQEVSALTIVQQGLLEEMAVERTRQEEMAVGQKEELVRSLSIGYRLILPMPQADHQRFLGRSPHQE